MITPETLTITMDDCRKAGHCASGVRRWMHRYGFHFQSFMRNGITARQMLDQNDGDGNQVVARTVKRRIIGDQSVSEDLAIAQLEAGIDG